MLSFFNLPCAGFCEMSELLTVPWILIGNRQLFPGVASMSPVEFSPQSANVINAEQSEAARAKGTGIEPVASTISAKATTLDKRVIDFLIFMQKSTLTKIRQVRAHVHCLGQSASRRPFLNPAEGIFVPFERVVSSNYRNRLSGTDKCCSSPLWSRT
jgi:hypothetical protein